MSYSASILSLSVYPKNSSVNVRKTPSTSAVVLLVAPVGKIIGTTTGNFQKQSDGHWFAVLMQGAKTEAWVREDVVTCKNSKGNVVNITFNAVATPANTSNVSLDDAKSVVNNLVQTDQKVQESIMRSLLLASNSKQKGKNVDTQLSEINTLQKRLNARQNALKTSTLLKVNTGVSGFYTKMTDKIKSIWSSLKGFGEPLTITVGTGVVIGVSFLVGAASAYLLYQTFKPKYSESTVDLKMSEDLERALSSVEPEVAASIRADLEKQIDKAYNQGKENASFFGLGKTVKYVCFAAIGFVGLMIVNKTIKNKKQNNDTVREISVQ